MDGNEQKRKDLFEEYKLLLGTWDDHARRELTIKGWILAGSLVGIATVMADGNKKPWFGEVALAAVLVIGWLTNAIWASHRERLLDRSTSIEEYFRGEKDISAPFQIHAAWEAARRSKPACAYFFSPYVFMPYLPLLLLVGLLACARHLGG